MTPRNFWKYVPPAGPVLSILLIALVLLSALLYYRAVKIQRFMEPALALSQPRNEFTKSISQTFQKEFGAKSTRGLAVKTSSIFVNRSHLFAGDGSLRPAAAEELRKLARVLLSLMKNGHTRSDISLVLIMARFPSFGPRGADPAERWKVQRMVGIIQDALFRSEPELGIRYSTYFAAAVRPTNPHEGNGNVVEIRIVPSEFLHIEVLEKLEKYAF